MDFYGDYEKGKGEKTPAEKEKTVRCSVSRLQLFHWYRSLPRKLEKRDRELSCVTQMRDKAAVNGETVLVFPLMRFFFIPQVSKKMHQ